MIQKRTAIGLSREYSFGRYKQNAPAQGEIPVTIYYTYTRQGLEINVENCYDATYLMLPVIASPAEEVKVTPQKASINKE